MVSFCKQTPNHVIKVVRYSILFQQPPMCIVLLDQNIQKMSTLDLLTQVDESDLHYLE